jgi:hypothetical protein
MTAIPVRRMTGRSAFLYDLMGILPEPWMPLRKGTRRTPREINRKANLIAGNCRKVSY